VRLDPGEHTVVIESDRGDRREQRLLLVEGEASRMVTLRFPPAGGESAARPPLARSSRHVPLGAWILGGAGLVVLGGAAYFGVAASGDLNALESSCSPHCSSAQTQPGRTDALLFDVSLGVGAAAVGAALVWGLAFPSRSTTAAAPRLEVRPIAGGALTALTLVY